MDPARLPLRDVHLPPPPSWWPPAPGWWWLGGAVLLALLVVACIRLWRRARRRRWRRWFDAQCAAGSPPQRIAAMSALLRRAARRRRPGAELLQGEDWLRFLDGDEGAAFSAGAGRLLLEGGFRPRLEPAAVEAAGELARARFLELMEARR
ncbi:hypothetical protein B1992_07880 [Pseudoxanthomonas broegbernensis]|uniref:DUF4381 domain-containing protein n=1 Tax=Pseudoxanthomonas broegbernensis TaxID=83619 RepID=A0A7V8GMK3_9GAMM|nr:DUF4381 family protein [Pseudoxanthomonas broegbernensis]KAF1686461.1 hypothetical protein B1992_07880 [Pseudoxanthomonas broegbernensis]MBB6064284.1 hypothetical protein [Pseudoxanthomonas broegbernensis]